jgi:hypothetical protein
MPNHGSEMKADVYGGVRLYLTIGTGDVRSGTGLVGSNCCDSLLHGPGACLYACIYYHDASPLHPLSVNGNLLTAACKTDIVL